MLLAFRCGMPPVADVEALNGVVAALPLRCVRLRVDAGDFADVAAATRAATM